MWFKKSIFLALLLFSSASAWAMGHLSTQTSHNLLIVKTAPDIVLTRTDGTTASIVGSCQGKKAILIFWATWCPHCYEELGTINENYASITQKGIKIVLINVGETPEQVKKYFDQRQMKLVSFIDMDNASQETYHLVGIPTLIFIDEKGVIRNVTHEFPSDYESYFSAK